MQIVQCKQQKLLLRRNVYVCSQYFTKMSEKSKT